MAGPSSLVVTNDERSRNFLRGALSRFGFQVSVAMSGQDGITQFAPAAFHIVLVDRHLPDMSGLEVLRKLKRISPEVAAVMIAADGAADDVLQAMRLGAKDYLIKPLEEVAAIDRMICRISGEENLAKQNREYKVALERRNSELRDHVELLRRDQEAGRLLQQHLLPRTPYYYPGGVEAAYRLVPSLYLSGDFVDYGLFGERFVAFYLVDVSGHGVSSALVTALIKHSIMHRLRERPLFAQLDSLSDDLLDVLDLVNTELLSTSLGKHASMFVGVVDSSARQLHYSVAGQLPMPALISESGAEWLPGKGRPLGIFERGDWQVMRADLPPTWRLAACSDGVLELLQGDLLEKEAQLLQAIADSGGELEPLCQALKVDTFGALPDDITILTLGCH
ncbi:SpoIIE family protein phosphatase [Microbulbifer sp. OS29]|uniref:SpoIIE family protein phosphatase n=1 Tax=Microbulbifer okhotskensis TaxID=2926617 RepID=A0A9X2EU39_9GAMM|nr:SpoIIE family protein phosphatase [Microbulbifer okhotskensis]MCO1335826.1 SpoIIE family protein phosphatase [Microbulbifer okhotskensis]